MFRISLQLLSSKMKLFTNKWLVHRKIKIKGQNSSIRHKEQGKNQLLYKVISILNSLVVKIFLV
jgi:hypothetical protein